MAFFPLDVHQLFYHVNNISKSYGGSLPPKSRTEWGFSFVKIFPLDGVSYDYVGLFGGQPGIVNPSKSGDISNYLDVLTNHPSLVCGTVIILRLGACAVLHPWLPMDAKGYKPSANSSHPCRLHLRHNTRLGVAMSTCFCMGVLAPFSVVIF